MNVTYRIMPELTRRRDPCTLQETWLVYRGDCPCEYDRNPINESNRHRRVTFSRGRASLTCVAWLSALPAGTMHNADAQCAMKHRRTLIVRCPLCLTREKEEHTFRAGPSGRQRPPFPDNDQVPQRSEMTRRAKSGLIHCSKTTEIQW